MIACNLTLSAARFNTLLPDFLNRLQLQLYHHLLHAHCVYGSMYVPKGHGYYGQLCILLMPTTFLSPMFPSQPERQGSVVSLTRLLYGRKSQQAEQL